MAQPSASIYFPNMVHKIVTVWNSTQALDTDRRCYIAASVPQSIIQSIIMLEGLSTV